MSVSVHATRCQSCFHRAPSHAQCGRCCSSRDNDLPPPREPVHQTQRPLRRCKPIKGVVDSLASTASQAHERAQHRRIKGRCQLIFDASSERGERACPTSHLRAPSGGRSCDWTCQLGRLRRRPGRREPSCLGDQERHRRPGPVGCPASRAAISLERRLRIDTFAAVMGTAGADLVAPYLRNREHFGRSRS